MSYYVDRTDGRGNTTTTAYDSFGQAASVTDAAGAITRYAYDPFGQLVAVTNALGNVTEYAYDVRGNKMYEGGATYPATYACDLFNVMTNMTTYRTEPTNSAALTGSAQTSGQAPGDVTTWLYDAASGVLTNKLYADGHGPSYTYTDTGRLATRTWARGVVTAYAYDGWGNLTNTAYSDTTPTVSVAYDALGRQISATDAAGVTIFEYDQYGQNTNETAALAGIVRRYDEFGRNIGYSHSSGSGTSLSYDPVSGRLASAAFDGNAFAYHYLPGTDLPSVLSAPGFDKVISYEPSRDLVTGIAYTNSALIAARIYGYDVLGNVTNRVQRRGTDLREDVFANDVRRQLTNAVLGSASYAYAFDDIGNRLSAAETNLVSIYTANSLNQYTNILSGLAPFSPEFDLDGNQTLIRTPTGVWTVSYNGENRPVVWSNGTTVIAMSFDRMGRRIEKTTRVDGVVAQSARFAYDGYLQVAEYAIANGQPSVVTRTFWDPSEPVATRPLAMKDADGAIRSYTVDLTKNVCELLNASGGIETAYDYASFGTVTASGAASPNRFQWSSEYNDAELGLVCYNYRHYNPTEGRWIGRERLFQDYANEFLFLKNRNGGTDRLGLYDEAVHFYLVYGLLRELGYSDNDAMVIAQGSQYPDTGNWDATKGWFWPSDDTLHYREIFHNLNELSEDQRCKFRCCIKCLLKAETDLFLKGVYLHVLGDTYAHQQADDTNYSAEDGHTKDLFLPDNPQWYTNGKEIGKNRLEAFVSEIKDQFKSSRAPTPNLDAMLSRCYERNYFISEKIGWWYFHDAKEQMKKYARGYRDELEYPKEGARDEAVETIVPKLENCLWQAGE